MGPLPSWEGKSEKVPPGNKNKGYSFSRALIPSHLHTQGCCFFSPPLTFMISSPTPVILVSPQTCCYSPILGGKLLKQSLDPPLPTFFCSLLAFYQKRKKIRKIPILLFLIPPLRFLLEPLPTRLSHPALQLPGVEQAACVPAGASIALS